MLAPLLNLDQTTLLLSLLLLATPPVSFLAACLFDSPRMSDRGALALAVSTFALVVGLSGLAGIHGTEILAPSLLAVLCLWSVQWAAMLLVFLVWKSGLRTAHEVERKVERQRRMGS